MEENQPTCSGSIIGPTSTLLPPCRVCGQKASGLHYGVNTCEACKRFFFRNSRTAPSFKCKGQKCATNMDRRMRCSYCRLKKCTDVGMSMATRKMGRYTIQQRTKNILEIKALENSETPEESNGKKQFNPSRDSKNKANKSQFTMYEKPVMSPVRVELEILPDNFDATDTMFGENFDAEIVIEKLVASSRQYSMLWRPFHYDTETWNRQVEFCKQRDEQIKAYGPSGPFAHLEKHKIYQDLGLDLKDERFSLKIFRYHLEICVMKMIRFAKTIPGFKELPLDDQANLVKYSRFEYWLLGTFRAMNPDLNVSMFANGVMIHRDDMSAIHTPEYIREVFSFCRRLHNIPLLSEEFAILMAIILTYSDRTVLINPEKVDEMQLKLMSAFRMLLRRNHPSEHQRVFATAMNTLIEMRSLTEWNCKMSNTLVSNWPELARSPLILELFTM